MKCEADLTDAVPSAGVTIRQPLTPEQRRRLTRAASLKAIAAARLQNADAQLAETVRTVHADSGASLASIGEAVGLTKQRVEQLVHGHRGRRR